MIKLNKVLVIDIIALLLILLGVYATTAKVIDGRSNREKKMFQAPIDQHKCFMKSQINKNINRKLN